MATDGEPDEPDARFTLANERTFLAYVRTSLALIAGGVAVAQLRAGSTGLRDAMGTVLIALGLVTSAWGFLRWRGIDTALAENKPVPSSRLPLVLTLGLVVVTGAATLLVIRT